MNPKFGRLYDDLIPEVIIKHPLSKTITESDNNLFCLLTMNHHPVHIDIEHAKQSHHGKILVVGTLVLSLIVGLTVPEISGAAIANLEYSKIKHLGPVFLGDTLRAETKVIDKRLCSGNDSRGVVHVETIGYNQKNEKIISLERKVLLPVS
ncbi:MaoC family dehydratase [Verrucomicrobia bacterium]|nr:MaoC family dehydratase [Verrucomicrobiota bacterium]